ncbi:MAG: hypothetical protein LQ338_007770 [Usnochroma carphineum]|nr:MAG: hypothetical protein LQ338_007770 [Usnochroma carphineum]
MCHVRHIDYSCKHLKCTLWKTCDEYWKLPQPQQEAMMRSGVLRCSKDEGITEEITIYSGRRAAIVAQIDRATKTVNKKLPFGIQLPSAGCKLCHKAHELSKMIVNEKCSKIEKLAALVKQLEEDQSTEQNELERDGGRKNQDQGAKHLLDLYRAQNETGVMMMQGPLVPTEVTTLLLYGRHQSSPEGAEGETSSSRETHRP